MIMMYWACSVTIFSKANLPKDLILDRLKNEDIIFAAAISCCIKEGMETYSFITELYPVYIIMKKYIKVYKLDFCTIKYVPGW